MSRDALDMVAALFNREGTRPMTSDSEHNTPLIAREYAPADAKPASPERAPRDDEVYRYSRGGKVVTRVERYGWEVQDKPGEFQWIHKDHIFVDHRYQRGLKLSKVLALAAKWSWIACSAISVAQRPGETIFHAMEGQHRLEALKRRADITMVPCMVFATTSVAEESRGFLNANSNRKPVGVADKHKAMMEAGDREAQIIDDLAKSVGRVVGPTSGPTSVHCVAIMLTMLAEDEKSLRKAYALAARICDKESLTKRILAGLYYVERHLEDGCSITDTKITRRLADRGYQTLNDAIHAAVSMHGSASPKVCALGMVACYNKGLRNGHLRLRD